jgi:hypothetical protein
MSSFTFTAVRRPFPRWLGPFSPARGTYSGFRFHSSRFGTWVGNDDGKSFWPLVHCAGAQAIASIVLGEWGGGRVLLLPNGLAIKPLQGDMEVGRRVVIGRFQGSVVVDKLDGTVFDLSNPGELRPGDPWPGPRTTGLECAIQSDGALVCTWYHPSAQGRDEVSYQLRGPDASLVLGFRKARPGDTGGRVRITANGRVITNRQLWNGAWVSTYIGQTNPGDWADWSGWVQKEKT